MLSSVVLFPLISSLSMLLLIFGSVHLNPGPFFNLNLSVAHLNARSLNADDKFREISVLASLHGFDLFAFSETWLTSCTFNESILLPGYSSPLRKERIGKRGGGLALYVRDNIVVKRRVDLEPSNQLELLWAQCNVKNFTILCGVCYRPPNSPLMIIRFSLILCSVVWIKSFHAVKSFLLLFF